MTAPTTHPTSTGRHRAAADPDATTAPSRVARLTGLAYLGIVVTGIAAEFAVRGSLVVADDAVATAANIAGSPGLFRAGIGADLLMVALDAAVAIGLYRLLRPVDRRLATAAMVLRLVQGAVIAVNLRHLVSALDLATQASAATGTAAGSTLAAEALAAVEAHALGYDVGLIAFALSCLVLSRLLLTSQAVPRWLAVGMGATGVVYLVGSGAALLAPGLSAAVDPLYLIAIVVEPAFAVRLLTKGLRPAAHAA